MNAVARRGACPALSAPMMTGDGMLVRLNPTASGLSPKTLIGLCQSAQRHGNGVVEVTARGSFQIRGLTPQSGVLLASDVNALGIAVRSGVPVETGPLAGIDPEEMADPRPLAAAIRANIAAAGLASRLGPKVSVVVDGGGHSGLNDVLADVRLTAVQSDGRLAWRLAIAGNARSAQVVGDFEDAAAGEATVSILSAIADIGLEGRARALPSPLRGGSIRTADRGGVTSEARDAEGTSSTAFATPSGHPPSAAGRPPRKEEGGVLPLRDSRFALPLALPFGSIEASTLIAFLDKAERIGAVEIRFAPRRTLLILTPSVGTAEAILSVAAEHGLIVSPADPRLSIAACPGKPACASGKLATRDIAMAAARDAAALFDGSFTLHVSGCAKGCAHPGPADLTIVGGENGAGLVVDGTAGHTPLAYTPPDRLPEALARLARRRAPGEYAKACLARLGPAKVATLIEG